MSQGRKQSARCTQRLVLIIAGLASLGIGLARPALAAGPQERIGEILAAVLAVTQDPQLQGANHQMERKQRVRRIIVDAFDFAEMGRVALQEFAPRLLLTISFTHSLG
jgi:hypothetical protein